MEEVQVIFDPTVPLTVVKETLAKIETYPCMPLLAEEILYYSFPESLQCPNPSCANSLKNHI